MTSSFDPKLIDDLTTGGVEVTEEEIVEFRREMGTLPRQNFGETPITKVIREGSRIVVLLMYAPQSMGELYLAIFNAVTATWGKSVAKNVRPELIKWVVEHQVLMGATLNQALEIPTFVFGVEGAPRSAMDQHFRPRIGAGFCAQGVRDNDARHRPVILPREVYDLGGEVGEAAIGAVVAAKAVYSALVDAGVSYQGARAVLPMGIENNWIGIYNWLALSTMMSKRLQLCEQPETVEVAWQMWEEVFKWNAVWGLHLLPGCVRAGTCTYSKSYAEGRLFSDLMDPGHCPIRELMGLQPVSGYHTFSSVQPLAVESFVDDRLLTGWIRNVVGRRLRRDSWATVFAHPSWPE